MNEKGFRWSEAQTLLLYYFPLIFIGDFENRSSSCFIRPEAYFQLLNYDSLRQSKKDTAQASWIAIIAVSLTLISIIVEIIISICK
jgi:hypothetical protein